MRRLAALSHLVHDHFIWLLLGSYALAAVWPDLGLAIRKLLPPKPPWESVFSAWRAAVSGSSKPSKATARSPRE